MRKDPDGMIGATYLTAVVFLVSTYIREQFARLSRNTHYRAAYHKVEVSAFFFREAETLKGFGFRTTTRIRIRWLSNKFRVAAFRRHRYPRHGSVQSKQVELR